MERSKQPAQHGREINSRGIRKARMLGAWLVGLLLIASCGIPRQDDDRRFDELQADFNADPSVFEDAVAVMSNLIGAEPTAERIGYSLSLVCVLPEGKSRASVEAECRTTDAAEEAIFRALPNASGVVYQAKDGERYIFRFNLDQPPAYHIMFAANDDNPETFAKDRGFRSSRDLNDGWSLMGPISDLEDRNAQWLE